MPRQINNYRPENNPIALSPGTLRHLVSFASASATQDSFGQPVNTWPVYLTVRASVRQLSGQELYQSDEFTSAAQVRVVIRWPGSGITVKTGDRIFFGTHTYVVQIVDNVQLRNRVLQLTCLEIDGTS